MKVSYKWLSSYFAEPLPEPDKLAEILTMHSFEIESLEKAGDDTILDCKILPDRAHDLLCHAGMAREVSLLTGKKIKQLLHPIELPPTGRVEVSGDPKETPRLTALYIEGVQVGSTPEWLKSFIGAVGQKSINSVVDNTNLTMLHVGQPLHAYDADKLVEKDGKFKLVAERAGKEEDFLALDGKTYKLTPEMLVIRDGNSGKTLGIAGIKGGVESKVDEHTKRIIVEAANFNPVLIRKTSQKLKLRTDASERFEKAITPELTHTALQEFAVLMKEMSPTLTLVGISDFYPKPNKQFTLGISSAEVSKSLGISVTDENLEDVLKALGWTYKKVIPEDRLRELVPTIIGKPYDRLASTLNDAPEKFSCGSLVNWLLKEVGFPTPRVALDMYFFGRHIDKSELQFGDFVFTNTGVQIPKDSMIYSKELGKEIPDVPVYTKTVEFLPGREFPKGIDHVGMYIGEGKLVHTSSQIGHAVIEDLDSSKTFENECWYARMAEDLRTPQFVIRIPHERLDIRLKADLVEEVGRVHGYGNLEALPLPPTDFKLKVNKEFYYIHKMRKDLAEAGYSEVMTYSLVKKGEMEIANPLASDKKFLRTSLLPALEEAWKHNKTNKDLLMLSEVKLFEIGKIFKDGKEILALAKMPDKEETDLGAWIEGQPEPLGYEFGVLESDKSFAPISSYPFIVRDIAVLVPEGTPQYELEKILVENSTELMVKTYLFDEFKKDGQVSYAYRIVFQSSERTLTDGEVNAIMENICRKIEEKKWKIR